MDRLTLPELKGQPLAGCTLLITGAAGTLGKVAACACAAAGGRLVLLDQDVAGLEALRDEILTQQPDAELGLLPMDLASAEPEHYLKLTEILRSYTSSLHGLVHNAAHLDFLEPLACLSPKRWFVSLQVNLNAPFLLTRACLPLLNASGEASVVFTSDSTARLAPAYWGAYAVAKTGVETLARILAAEWEARGSLRANILVPGKVATSTRRRAFPGEAEESLTSPQSLAKLYVYLLSSASRGQSGYTYFHQDEQHVLRAR